MEFTVKKLSAILVCLLMIITCGLAGCASFSINKVKYYNEVLAMVDETKITRFDLLSAYNSYGQSYYVQQMGKSEEEALSSTLDLLIERELLYQHALENDDIYKPTAYQVNVVIEKMFESLDSQMDKYVETAKTILQIEDEKTEEESKEDETAYKHEDYVYSPRARVKSRKVELNTEYYIEYIIEDEEEEYAIVGARESDPMNNRISNECPIGAALLGHKEGEIVNVESPDGMIQLKILEIRL